MRKQRLLEHRISGNNAIAGAAYEEHHRFIKPAHFDLLAADIHIHPLAVHLILIWVIRIKPFNEHILGVKSGVGQSPGDAVVVTDHDAR